jgi:hypothetical protein
MKLLTATSMKNAVMVARQHFVDTSEDVVRVKLTETTQNHLSLPWQHLVMHRQEIAVRVSEYDTDEEAEAELLTQMETT